MKPCVEYVVEARMSGIRLTKIHILITFGLTQWEKLGGYCKRGIVYVDDEIGLYRKGGEIGFPKAETWIMICK